MFVTPFLLKLKSAFLAALQFCLDNWKVVIPVLLLLFGAYKYNAQVKRGDELARKLQESKAQVKSMAESLQESAFAIQKQNLLIEEANKRTQTAQKSALDALMAARQANISTNNKKQAIQAKINIEKPDTCETAIDEIKALLK